MKDNKTGNWYCVIRYANTSLSCRHVFHNCSISYVFTSVGAFVDAMRISHHVMPLSVLVEPKY